MKQPCVVAILAKDAVEQLPIVVPVHEVPVLMAVHGDNRVSIDEGADLPAGVVEFEFEDPADEFARLEQRYGVDKDTKRSFAEMAYGSRSQFIDRMHQAAAEAEAPDDAQAAPAPARRRAQAAPAPVAQSQE